MLKARIILPAVAVVVITSTLGVVIQQSVNSRKDINSQAAIIESMPDGTVTPQIQESDLLVEEVSSSVTSSTESIVQQQDSPQSTETTTSVPITPEQDHCSVSWHDSSVHGPNTASGEVFDENAMTGANRILPFGTMVRIHYLDKSVDIRINDRTPQSFGRCFDITKAAFSQIADPDRGIVLVTYEIL